MSIKDHREALQNLLLMPMFLTTSPSAIYNFLFILGECIISLDKSNSTKAKSNDFDQSSTENFPFRFKNVRKRKRSLFPVLLSKDINVGKVLSNFEVRYGKRSN